MPFFLNALYTIFLGVLLDNLINVRRHPNTRRVTVTPLIDSTNASRSLPLVALMVIDWVCFAIVFPATQEGGEEAL